ncbi:MAG: ComEC/Rec2 family competence protein, partial [Anaerolinea sp.]|nr:ComEC/Rec2 family competence protein [Anaerolinea sp.]
MRLVFFAAAWCIGIGLAHTPALHNTSPWWLFTGIAVAACFWFWPYRQLRVPSLLLAALTLGGLRMAFTGGSTSTAAYNDRAGAVFIGHVIDDPLQRDNGSIQFTLEVDTVDDGNGPAPVSGYILVRTHELATPVDVRYGDRVRAHGSPVTPPQIDGFDYAAYLARSDIYTLLRDAQIEVLQPGGGHPLIALLLAVKSRLRDAIETALPDPAAAFLRGVLLGDDALPDTLRADFATSGTAHLIAVSGFNLVVMASASAGFSRWLGGSRRTATIAGVAATTAYALLVGMSGGVFRAWVMVNVVIIGDLLRRRSYVPSSLALAVILLTLIEPRDLLDVSFQMSAAAALGLATLARPLSRWFQRIAAALTRAPTSAPLRIFSDTLAASTAAFLFVTPFTAHYFGRVSTVAIPVNLLVTAVQPLLLIGGTVGALAGMFIPAIGGIVLLGLWPALMWTIAVTRAAARLPFADVAFDIDSTALFTFIITTIGFLMIHAVRPRWYTMLTSAITIRTLIVTAVLGTVLILAVCGSILSAHPDQYLHLWVLDMDGDNAVLLQTPGGAHVLMDGGSSPRRLLTAIGDRLPLNKRHLDLLIISAAQAWNSSALLELLARYPAYSALISPQDTSAEVVNQIYALLPSDTTVRAQAGQRIQFSDGTEMEILHPPSHIGTTIDPADAGIALRVRFGEITFLLTGNLSL